MEMKDEIKLKELENEKKRLDNQKELIELVKEFICVNRKLRDSSFILESRSFLFTQNRGQCLRKY